MHLDFLDSYFQMLPEWFPTFCGLAGFCTYLMNYTLVTFQLVSSQGIAFFAINICAASLVLISLMENFNLGAMLIQVFWIGLGSVAILIRLRARGRRAPMESVMPSA